jgi:hypothetical protein
MKRIIPEQVSFFRVPLRCGMAPEIGCGSLARPLLVALERIPGITGEDVFSLQGRLDHLSILPTTASQGTRGRISAEPRRELGRRSPLSLPKQFYETSPL